MSRGPYGVVAVEPRKCIDCGGDGYCRVVDTRKTHGERYPGPLRCGPCAVKYADRCNAEIASRRKAEGPGSRGNMNDQRLRNLAWEAIDSEEHDHAVCISPTEMLWLLRQWPRGQETVVEMRKDWKSQEVGEG